MRLDVITTQATALTDEKTAVTILGERMNACVLLIQYLGGGWTVIVSMKDKFLTHHLKIGIKYCVFFILSVSIAFASDDHPPSIEDLNRAIAINPNSADAYYDRGILWEKQGNMTQAIADFTQTIKINPKMRELIIAAANAYAEPK